MIDRRTFIGLGLACCAIGIGPAWAARTTRPARIIGCRSDADDRHRCSAIGSDGQVAFDVPLPARGHGLAADPISGLIAVFARRPGRFVWLIDPANGEVVRRIGAAAGRHFYGHGAFTPDGRLLCSENAYDRGDGVIGSYDILNGGRRCGEFQSHGIGPHEVLIKADGRTLIVANGGIRTHPELPRVKQNLDSMRPNLAYVDSNSGDLLHQVEPPAQWHQLSIRHIALAPDDTVAVAMQFEGNPLALPPVIATQRDSGPLRLLRPPDAVQRRLRNYCGSVAFDRGGERFAVTSPRGNTVTYWHRSGEYLGLHRQADACGAAAGTAPGGFVFSDGSGGITRVTSSLAAGSLSRHDGWRWDNHLIAV